MICDMGIHIGRNVIDLCNAVPPIKVMPFGRDPGRMFGLNLSKPVTDDLAHQLVLV
jgi:hypothetical protein